MNQFHTERGCSLAWRRGQPLFKKLPPGRCKAPSSVSQHSTPPSPDQICAGRHLGGGFSGSGPAGFGLWLVGVSRLGARGAQGVPSLASLLKVALVPGGLRQHLHPPLLVLLQASPELHTLPLTLHLPGKGKGDKLRPPRTRTRVNLGLFQLKMCLVAENQHIIQHISEVGESLTSVSPLCRRQ